MRVVKVMAGVTDFVKDIQFRNSLEMMKETHQAPIHHPYLHFADSLGLAHASVWVSPGFYSPTAHSLPDRQSIILPPSLSENLCYKHTFIFLEHIKSFLQYRKGVGQGLAYRPCTQPNLLRSAWQPEAIRAWH